MAITHEWQILDADKVYAATAYLDDAVEYLKSAIELIETGKSKSNYEVFHTNEGNIIPSRADGLIGALNNIIAAINSLKSNVNSKASSIESAERQEYRRYVEEQQAEQEQTAPEVYRV